MSPTITTLANEMNIAANQPQDLALLEKRLLFQSGLTLLQKAKSAEMITVKSEVGVIEDASLRIGCDVLETVSKILGNVLDVQSKWEKVVASLNDLDSKVGSWVSDYNEQRYIGMKFFMSLWKLNESLAANCGSELKNASAYYANPIITAVTNHQQWIRDFIYQYATNEMDLYIAGPTTWVCEVRSGIQFLFDAFYGYSDDFDIVLNSFQEDISEFDCRMEVWMDSGCSLPLRPTEIPKIIPSGHVWWF